MTKRPKRARHGLKTLATACLLTTTLTTTAHAITEKRAWINNGNFSEFTQASATSGSITTTTNPTYEGAGAARAHYNGSGSNGYARTLQATNIPTGSDIWYGAAYYLPTGFKANMQGQIGLIRLDNWVTYGDVNDKTGVYLFSDKRAYLARDRQTVEQAKLTGAFDLPEGRWFWLEIHQKLDTTDGKALNTVYIDGNQVAHSTTRNTYGRPYDRARYGIVHIDAGKQNRPLTLYYDTTTLTNNKVGPLGSAPAPAPEPAPAPAPAPAPEPAPAPAPQPAPAPAPAPAPGEVNLAHQRPVSASSQLSWDHRPWLAVDGRSDTRWASKQADGQWWQVDLGSRRALRSVKIDWDWAFASRYRISTSPDAKNWTARATVSIGAKGWKTTPLDVTTRYVRITALERATRYWVSFAEAQVIAR